jgi:DNA uptake protein ComE-like DNA-binding protein
MAGRFDRRAVRDPRIGLRAERTKLLDADRIEASQVMHEAHAQARYLVESARREAEELLDAARATGRGVIAEAEEDAEELREKATLDREQARILLSKAKAAVAKARVRTEGVSRTALRKEVVGDQLEAARALGDDAEPIDLNEATMEDLRVAGLSITQARRAIARRDRDGSYTSLDQLAELPGMPAALLERIKTSIRI